jgi:Bacterial surface proteins containing Ig-like domains
VTGVSLDRRSLSLAIGDSATLVATVTPSDATIKTLSWASGDASVATVSSAGLVTGIKQGSATITATTKDGGFSASCAVSVAAVGKVATPSFSVAGGSYVGLQILELSTTTSGAVIHYTTDGSTPTSSSASYDSEIFVTKDETVKAIAVKDGMSDSDLASASYKPVLILWQCDSAGAQYWVNGSTKYLTKPSDATSISLHGAKEKDGSIYCIGSLTFESGTREQPYFWKDGDYNSLSLPSEAVGGSSNKIEVMSGSIYMAGSYSDASSKGHPCYWKDGAFTPLSAQEGSVSCIKAVGGKIYIGGSINSSPVYWVDDTATELAFPSSSRSSASVNAITSSDGDVFFLGNSSDGTKSYPCYWQNGKYFELGLDTTLYTYCFCSGTCRFDGSLYIGGSVIDNSTNNWIPCYWKDGAITTLSLPQTTSISYSWDFMPTSKHLYVMGEWLNTSSYIECYWLNGEYHAACPGGNLSVNMY